MTFIKHCMQISNANNYDPVLACLYINGGPLQFLLIPPPPSPAPYIFVC